MNTIDIAQYFSKTHKGVILFKHTRYFPKHAFSTQEVLQTTCQQGGKEMWMSMNMNLTNILTTYQLPLPESPWYEQWLM